LAIPSERPAGGSVTLGDLLFIVLFLAAVVTLVMAVTALARGKRRAAATTLTRLAAATAVYLTVVYAVALLSPPRRLVLNEDLCSDDWCMAVTGVRRLPGASAVEVTFHLSSRARRISQREFGVLVYLRDDARRRIEATALPGEPPFDVLLGPSGSIMTRRRFAVEPGATPHTLVITKAGLGFPGCLILGEATALVHPTELPLDDVVTTAAVQQAGSPDPHARQRLDIETLPRLDIECGVPGIEVADRVRAVVLRRVIA
jgi:hypothetical protein